MRTATFGTIVWIATLGQMAGQPLVPSFTELSVLPANGRARMPLEPGMLVSVYGRHLGPGAGCTARHAAFDSVPELCQTAVTVNGVSAALLYVHAKQINLRVPPNVPAEGRLAFVVTYQGVSSPPVLVRFEPHPAHISLAGRAYVRMPIWIEVNLPGRLQQPVRYPITSYPPDFGGHDFEVRRNGSDFPKWRGTTQGPRAGAGPGSPGRIGGGGFIGLPNEPKTLGRLPLHLAFRFDRPGRYQVRYSGYDFGFPLTKRVLARSDWLSIQVEPYSQQQRHAWLEQIRRKLPSDPVELLSGYLPSMLAWTDEKTLAVAGQFLYHDHPLVRQYAMYSLYLFADSEIVKWMPGILRRRGPTPDLAYFLSWRRKLLQPQAGQLVSASAAHLRSESPLIGSGALQSLNFLRSHYDWTGNPQVPGTIDSAVIEHAELIVNRQSKEDLHALALYLGGVKTDRSRELLWRLATEGKAREQALICLTWIGDLRDLPGLAAFNTPGLEHHLRRAYGEAATPYLKRQQ